MTTDTYGACISLVIFVSGIISGGSLIAQQETSRDEMLERLEQQAVEAGFDLRRLDAVRELHNQGAEIQIEGQHVTLTFDHVNSAFQTMPDGKHRKIPRPPLRGALTNANLLRALKPDRISVKTKQFGIAELRTVGQLEFLTELRVNHHGPEIDTGSWQMLNNMPQLRRFGASSYVAGDELLAVLADLPNLEQIQIGYGTFSAAGIGQLQQSATLNNVSFSVCDLDDDMLREICLIPGLTHIGLYNIRGLSGKGYGNLAIAPKLKWYNASGNAIAFGVNGIVSGAIGQLSKLGNMDGILLWNNQLNDKLFPELLKSWEGEPDNRESFDKVLYLSGTKITDVSVEAILASSRVEFKTAFVALPDGVSRDAADKLQAAHPGWTIDHPKYPRPRIVPRSVSNGW